MNRDYFVIKKSLHLDRNAPLLYDTTWLMKISAISLEEKKMYITCLDLEGVLVPEIWIAFSEASGIPELKRTTRDEPDYDN